ncbi:MipA/OmpV family protein [Pseudoalteromonas sp. MMG022]|uniref:MipA/OmpV family protein n=1 Tax=Pseudoalteromonas sp. MMG022 TaxID=2909978 RepID=UPI001F3ACF13|nr:MipA/OmpV family protein [Pseudoalteromonas sp. MMG022]MCF6434756.1 MipA/OmpV family protein [Pseudoalteromonas sp. MMG022]
MLRTLTKLIIITVVLSSTAYASNRLYSDNTLTPTNGLYLDINMGLGYLLEDSYLIGVNVKDGVELLNVNVFASYGNWYLDADRSQLSGGWIVGYSAIEHSNWDLDVIVTQAQDGFDEKGFNLYNSDEIPQLKGITQRAFDVTGGLRLSRRFGDNQASLELLQDISSTHNGWIVSTFYSKIIPWQNWEFRTGLGINIYSRDFTNYYFGISPKEQRVDRPVYRPKSAMSVVYEFHAEYPLNENWIFLAGWMTTWFSQQIYRSPIVVQNYQHKAKIGVRYVF